MNGKRTISLIVPIYNEEKNINNFYQALTVILANSAGFDYEMIFVNDGSADQSAALIEQLARADDRIKYLEFSRNFGKEIATTAGLNNARGDAAIMIDADLQHPVELIPEFIAKWQSGAEVVVGVRKTNQGEGLVKKIGSGLFYNIINRIAEVKIIPQATDFRLIDRAVIDEFNRFTENNRMTRALIDWLGFKRDYIYFNANPRRDGKAKYGFWKLFRLAVSSFVSLSLLPLKLAGYLGMLIVFFSGVLGLYILVGKYIFHLNYASSFSGPAQLAILIIFLVGIILMSLGLIALYIADIHGQVAYRPLYVIRKNNFFD
ncbi:MAG: glycosyltransferase family 2 protein [Patescibacteria group bacterium]|nr:glycosyltransferase family 2 protein [Patescibacteria group bacterium]